MEYTVYNIQNDGSIGSVQEHWCKTSSPFSLLNPLYDSFTFNFPYTLRLQKLVTVTSCDGNCMSNGVTIQFVSLDAGNIC